jgi:proteic killer suppression protein
MIKSPRHKGVEKFFLTGSKAGIQPSHAAKLGEHLTVLNIASKPKQMNVPGWQWHALTADLAQHWSVSVNGTWRLTFAFEGEDAVLVDYQDYH